MRCLCFVFNRLVSALKAGGRVCFIAVRKEQWQSGRPTTVSNIECFFVFVNVFGACACFSFF
jgi:hypothetical protein